MVVGRAVAGVVPAAVLHAARGVLAGRGGARVPRVHLAVVTRVARRTVALISGYRHSNVKKHATVAT